MPIARQSTLAARLRSGLTVVEVLVALVVVSVGLLGMAGTASLSLRTAATARRERQALRRLDLRAASLAAGGCARALGGSAFDPRDSVRERWTVATPLGGAALVDARVEWRDGARTRSIAHRSAVLC
jgi:Tfp pilus assembly protein PilV